MARDGVSGPARRVRHATRSRSSVRNPHEAANSRENTVTTFSTAPSPTPGPAAMPLSPGCGASGFRHGHTGPPPGAIPVCPARRGWSGSMRITRRPGSGGQVGGDVDDQVAFGVDDQRPAIVGGVVAHQVRHQGGLPGAGRADDLQVMPRIGHRHPDRAAGGGVAVPQRLHPWPGHRDLWGWRHRGGSGAQQPGHVLVDREVG